MNDASESRDTESEAGSGTAWKLVAAVSAVLMLESVFFSALAPLLPYYVETLHISEAQAGVLVGIEAAGTFLIALPAGLLASRWGYRRTVLASIFVLAGFTTGFGFARSILLLDLLRFGQGCASAAAWTGAIAWLMTVSPPGRRGQVLGTALGAAATGSLVGPVLGAIAAAVGTAPAFLGVSLLFVPLGLVIASAPEPARRHAQPLASVLGFRFHPQLRAAFGLILLSAVVVGALTVVVPLRLDAMGWGATAVGAAFLVAAGVEGGTNPAAGRWSDRHGRHGLVAAASLTLGVLLVLVPAPSRPEHLVVLLVLATALLGVLAVSGMTLLSEGAERARLDRGLTVSLMNLAWAPGHAAGAMSSGALVERGGPWLACAVPALLCVSTWLGVRSMLE